jgi:hypothetical protein
MKKRIHSSLIVSSILMAMMIMPLLVFAQPSGPPTTCTLKHDLSSQVTGCGKGATIQMNSAQSICCAVDAVMTVTDWVFYILLVAVVLMVVIGGFMYLTSAGDPAKASKGRSLIIFALIGLIIAVFARAIPSIVMSFLGV